MGVMGHYTTLALILLFTLDVFTDIANGIELILNDHVVCKYTREKGRGKWEGRGHTVKKAFRYSRPQPGCHLPKTPWAGINS
jgi:hypothetical protein